MKPRVLLADDHVLLLDAFEQLLSADYDVVGKTTNGHALVAAAETLHPDVVVLDIAMPGLNGLEAARAMKQSLPNAKMVFLTMNEDTDLMTEAFDAGAAAYVLKRSAAPELITAIQAVLDGRSYVTPLASAGVVTSVLGQTRSKSHALTPRQLEVLALTAAGKSMRQIAEALNLTPKTVAFHKYRMMHQLGLRSTAELVAFATRHLPGI